MGDTQTLVNASSNIWDIYIASNVWTGLFWRCDALERVLSANTSNVTDMESMFYGCTKLENVPLFDTSNVTDMQGMFSGCTKLENVPLFDTSNVTDMQRMFYGCTKLKYIPLFDTSNVTDMWNMCRNCRNVESGALALYQQASGQTTPPQSYSNCFTNCGIDTDTGYAELAQIPASWGGTGA